MNFPTEPNNINRSSVPNRHRHFNRRLDFWLVILALVLLLSVVVHYHDASKSKRHKSTLAPVLAATAKTANVPIYLSALGTVTPTYTITVKTQINGQLLRVLFKEGQMVKAGDLMAEIDPRPYEAQLIEYTGQLERDQALLANARVDQTRYQTLWKQNSIAKQTLDTQIALVHQYEGAVKIDEGLIAVTKLNLIYCKITSPVNGRVGLRLVDPGNYVQTTDATGLFVIDTLDPITVVFTLPEDNIQDIVAQVYAGKSLVVKVYDRQQSTLLATGALLTMDNQIDPTTGTVKLKANFPNEKNLLFPSQFVNVQLLVKTLKNAVVIPTAAIQYGPSGSYVYILNANQTVSVKPVKVGPVFGDLNVITQGVSTGQRVITDGVDKLTDGAKVTTQKPNQKNTKGKS